MRKKQILLHDYFAQWIEVYKEGAVRERTEGNAAGRL